MQELEDENKDLKNENKLLRDQWSKHSFSQKRRLSQTEKRKECFVVFSTTEDEPRDVVVDFHAELAKRDQELQVSVILIAQFCFRIRKVFL